MGNFSVLLVLLASLLIQSYALTAVTPKQLEALASRTEIVVALITSSLSETTKDLSKRASDEFDRIVPALPDARIRLVSLSVDQHPEAFTTYHLEDLPSVVIFRDGFSRIYYGQRMSYSLFSFFQELLTVEPVKIIDTKQTKTQWTHDQDQGVRVIGFFPTESSPEFAAFRSIAKHLQGEIPFALVKDEKLAKTIKLKEAGSVAMYKPGEKPVIAKGLSKRESLLAWVQENKKALWDTLTFSNIYSVWQGTKTTFVAFVKGLDEHNSKAVLSVFKTLSKQYGRSNSIEFVIVDANVYKEFVAGVGLKEEDLPTFAIFQPMQRKEFFFPKSEQTLNVRNARKWLESFIAGKLTSEPSKRSDFYSQGGPVKLNADTLQPVVEDSTKDVLVEFYAPWCGHCASLAPHYKSVAEWFKPHSSVVIAAYDINEHSPPQAYNITTLPTLVFFPASDKSENPSGIPFAGFDRNRKGITSFVLAQQKSLTPAAVESIQKTVTEAEALEDTAEPTEVEETTESN